jgi:hypothetical protein
VLQTRQHSVQKTKKNTTTKNKNRTQYVLDTTILTQTQTRQHRVQKTKKNTTTHTLSIVPNRFHFTLILIAGTPTIPVLPATIGTSSAGQVGGVPFQPLPNFTASGAAIPSSMSFYD